MHTKIDLKLKSRKTTGWSMHSLEFENDKSVITTVIRGKLANVQTKRGRKKRLLWQQQISKEIKTKRIAPRNKNSDYVISLGMKFSASHPNQKQPIDVDNFIKPIFAGIAAGLFDNNEEVPSTLEKFKDFDDSHFRYLYVERLDNPQNEDGVAIVISEKPCHPYKM